MPNEINTKGEIFFSTYMKYLIAKFYPFAYEMFMEWKSMKMAWKSMKCAWYVSPMSTPFFDSYFFVHIYNILFVHSSVDGHCFCPLAVVDGAAKNIGVHFKKQEYNSL